MSEVKMFAYASSPVSNDPPETELSFPILNVPPSFSNILYTAFVPDVDCKRNVPVAPLTSKPYEGAPPIPSLFVDSSQ